jgi:hypothetical protein
MIVNDIAFFAEVIGKMLRYRTTRGGGDYLHPTAHTQQRETLFHGFVNDMDLPIAPLIGGLSFPVPARSIPCRVHVAAARDYDTAETTEVDLAVFVNYVAGVQELVSESHRTDRSAVYFRPISVILAKVRITLAFKIRNKESNRLNIVILVH